MAEKLYLRGDVAIEPLFSGWYAWVNLISPSTAPLYVVDQHLKIMQSFVAQPQVHIAAMKNPALVGGPYLNHGADRVAEISCLIDKTIKRQAKLIELAAAIKALDATLSDHPRGMSLEDLYSKVPEPLRGYVELSYDVRNQPSLRLLEGLLYRSPYYNETETQSLVLRRVDRDERSFVYSTPRLEERDTLHLPISFRHRATDALAELRRRAAPFGEIQELLGMDEQEPLLRAFLTSEPPPPAPPRYAGGGVRVRYFGHACVLIESRDVSILIDPVLSYVYPTAVERFTYADLPEKIDFVLISHTHTDHFLFETLLQLRQRIGTVVVPKNNGSLQDPSPRLALKNTGFRNVVEIEEFDEIDAHGATIIGLPFLGEHGDMGIRSKLAYLVRLAGRSVVLAADSNALEPMLYSHIRDVIGEVDALFLGMECEGAPVSWYYGPLLLAQLARKMDQSRRLNGSNCQRGAEIVRLLGPKQVYIYAMGQEPWLEYLLGLRYTEASPQILESNRLIELCRAAGLTAVRPYCKMEVVLA